MILRLESGKLLEAAKACAKELSKPGSVALVPTETVYGLLCAWSDKAARDRIYALKRRADDKPLAAFVPSVEDAAAIAGAPLPPNAEKAAKAFCPGPITIVVPDALGATFGFRIPDHPFILALLEEFGAPLASTSANLSGRPAALSVQEALASVEGEPEICVDGGQIDKSSKASTVVLFDKAGAWRILRPGPISQERLEKALR